ncbi:hypothetical protein SCG7109_AM_00060 [Chlamydiales bacterium SCGC AG-110-M15]|nr:hypothetical protein SCG7109_AM_00060 [Chlamydiales bacterium SCGC AG-110-M15]
MLKHILDEFTDPAAKEANLSSLTQEIEGVTESCVEGALNEIAVDDKLGKRNKAIREAITRVSSIMEKFYEAVEKNHGLNAESLAKGAQKKLYSMIEVLKEDDPLHIAGNLALEIYQVRGTLQKLINNAGKPEIDRNSKKVLHGLKLFKGYKSRGSQDIPSGGGDRIYRRDVQEVLISDLEV